MWKISVDNLYLHRSKNIQQSITSIQSLYIVHYIMKCALCMNQGFRTKCEII